MESVAKLRNCPMSDRKMRLVINLIRGKSVNEALSILKYTKKEAAEWVSKLLLSAIANWENKNDMLYNADDYDLYISEVFADGGTMLKRIQAAPQGRAHRIRKRTCHVTIKLKNRIALNEDAEVIIDEVIEENE